jgi:hypothetical protein
MGVCTHEHLPDSLFSLLLRLLQRCVLSADGSCVLHSHHLTRCSLCSALLALLMSADGSGRLCSKRNLLTMNLRQQQQANVIGTPSSANNAGSGGCMMFWYKRSMWHNLLAT